MKGKIGASCSQLQTVKQPAQLHWLLCMWNNSKTASSAATLPSTARYCTTLHCTLTHCTARYCTVLHCMALHSSALHGTVVWFPVLHFTALHRTALNCIRLSASPMPEARNPYCPLLNSLPSTFYLLPSTFYILHSTFYLLPSTIYRQELAWWHV